MAFESLAKLRDRTARRAKTVLALIVAYSGLLFFLRLLQRPHILVVAYHRVSPEDEIGACAYPHRHVPARVFAQQLQALRRLYRIVPLSEVQEILTGKRRLRRHVALVTFDDGYRDNYKHAFPVLQSLRMPATFFLSLGFVEDGRSCWFDRLAEVLRAWDRGAPAQRDLRALLPAPLAAAFDAPLPRRERLRQAVAFVAALPVPDRRALLKRLAPGFAPAPQPTAQPGPPGQRNRPLAWSDVRRMRKAGMEFGAHGVSHTALTRMPRDDARREIEESVQVIASRIGVPVTAFAYPAGAADADVAQLVSEAGVRVAFTLDPNPNWPRSQPLLLGRRALCAASSRSAFRSFSRAWFWCEVAGVFDMLSPRRSPATGDFVAAPAPERRWTGRELIWTGPQDCTRLRPVPSPLETWAWEGGRAVDAAAGLPRLPQPQPARSVFQPAGAPIPAGAPFA